MFARALVKTLPLPLLVLLGQAMYSLWATAPGIVIVLSIFFIAFVIAAQVVEEDLANMQRKIRR